MTFDPIHHSQPFHALPPLPPHPPRPRVMTLGAWIAWTVILIISIGLPVLGTLRTSTAKSAAVGAAHQLQFEITAKYAIGASKLSPDNTKTMMKTVDDITGADEGSKIRTAIVAGELEGTLAAVSRLSAIADSKDAEAFKDHYVHNFELSDGLIDRYGFFGKLAASHGKPDSDPDRAELLSIAQRIVIIFFILIVAAIILGLLSLGLFITAIVLLAMGKIRFQTQPPIGQPNRYVEAFAIYLAGYVVFGIALGLIWKNAPFIAHVLPLVAAVGLAISWPSLRGVPIPALRQDWGLHTGRNFVLEVLCGIGGYLAGLPLVVVCAVIAAFLAKLANFEMSHPIQSELTKSPFLLFLLAVVFAPITEELLFRGALLSHVRAWAGPWLAAILTGVIFAAIHPQGWPAIPLLGSIGFNLAMIRQWRGTLVAPITAHALNNGTVLTLTLLLLSE